MLKDFYFLGKGCFFLLTTLPGPGQNMVMGKSVIFLASKFKFWIENCFPVMGTRFLSRGHYVALAQLNFGK